MLTSNKNYEAKLISGNRSRNKNMTELGDKEIKQLPSIRTVCPKR